MLGEKKKLSVNQYNVCVLTLSPVYWLYIHRRTNCSWLYKKQHRHGNHSMNTAYWFLTFCIYWQAWYPPRTPPLLASTACRLCVLGVDRKCCSDHTAPCSWTGWQKRTRCSFWSGEQRGPNRADSFIKMSHTLLRYTQHLQLISQGTFLVVRWLRLHTSNARGGVAWWWGGWVQSLVKEPDPICRN